MRGRQRRGNYLVLLNNDTRVLAGWLNELIGTFELHTGTGYVGSKLLDPTGWLQEAGGAVWPDGSALNMGRGHDPEEPAFNYVRDVHYVTGAAVAIPRAIWEELSGFDDHFAPNYYEDTDLAFRVRKAGYRVLYQPLSRVVHFEGVTCGRGLDTGPKAYQLSFRTLGSKFDSDSGIAVALLG